MAVVGEPCNILSWFWKLDHIYLYWGVEAAIGSNLGKLLSTEAIGSLSTSDIAPYISMYWGSLMIGRWASVISVFKLEYWQKTLAMIIVPLIAFGVIVGVNLISGKNMETFYYYILSVLIQIGAFFWSKDQPARTLTILGLGKYTSQGFAFLILLILGGVTLPPIQRKLADMIGIQASYFLAVVCFAYLTLFAIMVKSILKKKALRWIKWKVLKDIDLFGNLTIS